MTGFKSKRAAAQDKLTVDREQLEQWLEALKDIDALHHPAEPESVDAQKAIADMWQALAQPAQEPVQVSVEEFVHIVEDKEHLVGRPIVWAQWPSKEKNK
jgi:hypothetical protein